MSLSSTLITPIVARPKDVNTSTTWARLEQEYVADSTKSANLSDLYQMRARAMSGVSALEYIYEQCPYARIADGVLTVTLDFYVWLSGLDIQYQLSITGGTLSDGSLFTLPRSFDVPFIDSAFAQMSFVFAGDLIPEMPFFAADGQIITAPDIKLSGSTVSLSDAATCVLRANGEAQCFKHSLVLQLSESPVINTNPYTGKVTELAGYALDDLATAVTVSWLDEHGDTQSTIMDIVIPSCVKELVTYCQNGYFISTRKDQNEPSYVVYVSACNGEVIKEGWEDTK